MWQPAQIKKEKSDSSSNALVCTCECVEKTRVRSSKNVRQVLVNFGLNRKKVFTLHGKNEKLYEQFKNHILSEPAFSELLEDSYVVFQEFSEKFGTWVDIDDNEKIKDGTVLNAVFFPTNIERDESNPGCIKKKEILVVTEKAKKKRPSEIINIDLTDEDEQSANSVKNAKHSKKSRSSKTRIEEQNIGEEVEVGNLKNNEKKAKKAKSSVLDMDELKNETEEEKQEENLKKNKEQVKKKKNILPGENDNETVHLKLKKNMETSDIKDEECVKKYKSPTSEENSQNDESKPMNLQKTFKANENWDQEESNPTTWSQDVNVSWHHQNARHETPRRRNFRCPETADNFTASENARQKNGIKTSRNLVQNGNSFVSQIYDVCSQNKWPDPVFKTKKQSGGFSCELKMKDTTYYKVHPDSFKVEEAVAELALNYMTDKDNCSKTYNAQYQSHWQGGHRRPYWGGYRTSW